MGLVEQAIELQRQEQASEAEGRKQAEDFIVAIALREATLSSRPTDAEDLVVALDDAGWQLSDYKELLDAIPKIAQHKQLHQQTAQLASERVRYSALYRRVQRTAEAQMHEAKMAWRMRESASSMMHDQTSRFTEYARRFPGLFTNPETFELVPEMAKIELPPERPKPATKRCDFCTAQFTPKSSTEVFCSYVCSRDSARLLGEPAAVSESQEPEAPQADPNQPTTDSEVSRSPLPSLVREE